MLPLQDSAKYILLVEDDRLVLATLRIGLKNAGYAILTAASGEEAIRMCREQQPDLILMDIRLPGISGTAAAKAIREIDDIPVVFLTAFSDTEIVEEAIEAGGMSYLIKPIEVHQIIPAIQATLARAAELRHLKSVEAQLGRALESDRITSIAIGILMERHSIKPAEAAERLKQQARPQRKKMADVAREIVTLIDTN